MPQDLPQHPSRVSQQGLGAPQQQTAQNPYYQSNAGLDATTANINGEAQLKQAQTLQAGAQAGKAQAEAEIMQGLGDMMRQQQSPIMPQEVQAQQLAGGILEGQIGQEQIAQMIQAGELDPSVAQAAMGMAQEQTTRDQAAYGGLGTI